MQDVEILHREAMELVDQAFLARQKGDTNVALELTKAAFSCIARCRKLSVELI